MKNGNLPFATTQIDLEEIILSEISQTEAKHCMYLRSLKKKKKKEISENNNKTDCNVENQWEEGRGAK